MIEKTCAFCQKPMKKRASESWVIFADRKTCSIKCGALYRPSKKESDEQKAVAMEQAALRLSKIIFGWHKPQHIHQP